MQVRLSDPAFRADLREFFHRWGCLTYEVGADTLEVIVPDAPAERQGRRELHLYLETWRAHITQVSSWNSSTDPSESPLSRRHYALPYCDPSPVLAQPRSCLEG